ncbi:hypothetical protein ACROYT_G015439 [Oculina patagonica]
MQSLVKENLEDVIELSTLEVDARKAGKEEKEGGEKGVEKEERRVRRVRESKEQTSKGEEESAEREDDKWDSHSSDNDSYDPAKEQASSSDEDEDQAKSSKRPCKKGVIEEDTINSLLAIVRAGPHQRGKIQSRKGKNPLKGKLKKWCPIPGCQTMVLDIGRHLSNPTKHSIENGTWKHQRYVCMAKQYTGLTEIDDNLTRAPPAIVELNPQAEEEEEEQESESKKSTAEHEEAEEEEERDEEDEDHHDENNYSKWL